MCDDSLTGAMHDQDSPNTENELWVNMYTPIGLIQRFRCALCDGQVELENCRGGESLSPLAIGHMGSRDCIAAPLSNHSPSDFRRAITYSWWHRLKMF